MHWNVIYSKNLIYQCENSEIKLTKISNQLSKEQELKLSSAEKRISELESLYESVISEKQVLQEKLIETQNRLIKTQKIGQTGSWEFEFEKNELFLSDEVFRIFGLSPTTSPSDLPVFYTGCTPG